MVAGEPFDWRVVVGWLRSEVGRPGAAVDHAPAVLRVAAQVEELVAAAAAHVELVRRSGGGCVAGPHRDSVERLEAALAGGLGKGVVFGDDLAEILAETPTEALADELGRRQEVMDDPAGVPRGTCPAIGASRRACGAPAADGEENLCERHAREADEVGRLVLGLVRHLRYRDA